MAKKKILLRLYNPHDIDLISLMNRHQMDIVKAVYCAITAFAKKESFIIQIPPLRESKLESRRIYSKHLILDTEKDKNVLQLLDSIDSGYRNNFLKNILRLYLFYPATDVFFTNKQNLSIFEEHYRCLIQGKRYVNAAILNCRKQKNTEVHTNRQSASEKSSTLPSPQIVTEECNSSNLLSKDQIIEKNTDTSVNESKITIDTKPFHQKESSEDESFPVETGLQMQESDDLTDLFTALLG